MLFAALVCVVAVMARPVEFGCAADATNCGKAALMAAAGYREKVLALLELGADVNAVSGDAWTALMFAAKSGATESVAALLMGGRGCQRRGRRRADAAHVGR